MIHFLMELSDSEESERVCRCLNKTYICMVVLKIVKARITDPVFLEGCHMNPTSTWRNYDPHLKTVHQHNCDFTSTPSLLLHAVSNLVNWFLASLFPSSIESEKEKVKLSEVC